MPSSPTETIDRYFTAQNTDDLAGLGACFTSDASVRDEGRVVTGVEAIRAWMADARARYQHVAEPVRTSERDGALVVTAKVSGAFAGSPADLDHVFRFEGGRIASLEIG